MAGTGRKVWAADEILAANDLQNYIQDQVVFVYNDSSARASGILSPTEGMVSYLKDTNLLYAFDGSSWVEIAPNVGTPGTYTKVTTDSKGRVSSGTTLSATDIPALDASKTTTGAFSSDRIPALDASKTTTGAFSSDRIPALDASKITTGTFAQSRITGTWDKGVYTSGGGTFFGGINAGSGGVYATGVLSVDGAITLPDVYNTTVGGPYRAVWVSSSGRMGNTSSSKVFKQDIVDADIPLESVRKLQLRHFRYIADVAERGDDAHVEVGLIAEELLEIPGMEQFVFFDEEDGELVPRGIHYERLALALIPAVQVLAEKMDLVEARLSKLESK